MSILTIAQNVAMEAGFSSPTSVIGNADEVAIQLLALIKRETRALSDRFEWQSLRKRYSFPFVNGTESYSLPSDFKDFIQNTMWNSITRRPLIGPITPEEYEIQKNYLVTSAIDHMFYIYGSLLYIFPVPATTDTIKYEYTTLNIYQTSGGVGKTAITLDTDTTTVREYLIELGVLLRFLVKKGLIKSDELTSSQEYRDYMEQVSKAIEKDGFGQRNPLSICPSRNKWWLAAHTDDSFWPTG